MATQAQTDANRVNAQQSTGPRTEEGKAKSSKNRLSHGFASNTRFIDGEDPEEFYALLNDFTGEHQPATPTQQVLVEKMAHHQWISLRAARLQGDAFNKAIYSSIPTSLPLLIRYQTTADRAFHKAHAELVKAQRQTRNSAIGFESKIADEAPISTAAATPEHVQEIPKAPVTPKKPAAPALSFPPIPDFATIDEEWDWLMTVDLEKSQHAA